MKQAIMVAVIVVAAASSAVSADQTWTGKISDGVCGDKHIGAAFGRRMSARDCTFACVRSGSTYVFVVAELVYNIANQHEPALTTYAGQTVTITGELKGDTITVSKIETPQKSRNATRS